MEETAVYIRTLTELKSGALGQLRSLGGAGLDEKVEGFDLFAGLWWHLRQKSPKAPQRKVAWLIAKLYAFRPLEQSAGDSLALQLRRCEPNEKEKRKRFRRKFDELLSASPDNIESLLQWALKELSAKQLKLDWVQLTDDLSKWEKESTRLNWAKSYLHTTEREQ